MNPQLIRRPTLLAALFIVTVFVGVRAQDRKQFDAHSLSKTAGVSWAKKIKQGFTMKLWMSNQLSMGQAAWLPSSPPMGDCNGGAGVGEIGLEYPVGSGTCIEHLYGAGPMIGGLVYDPATGTYARRVSEGYNGSDSRTEFYPEVLDTARDKIWRSVKGDPLTDYNFDPPHQLSQSVNRKKCDDDGDGKTDEDELDGLDNDGDWNPLTDDVGADGLPDSMEVSCDGKPYDPVTNHDPAQDNYEPSQFDPCRADPVSGAPRRKSNKDLYTEKNGIPDHGEPHVDEDYGAMSDNDLYFAVTDTARRSNFTIPGHIPMGIKVFQKSYAWRGDFANGILPMDYFFINAGRYTIKDVYVGFFADIDLGPTSNGSFQSNDYACYIPELRTAYIHNAVDRGSTPLGLTVLGASRPLDQLNYIFQWQVYNVMGTEDSILYSWMNGELFGGQLVKPCQPPETPGDESLFFSFGPFNGRDGTGFKPGDTLKISIAFVAGEGVDEGPRNLRSNAENAIKLFGAGFVDPIHLPSPKLVVEEGFKKATIRWFPSQSELGGPGPGEIWDDSNKVAESFPDTSFRRRDPPCIVGGQGACASDHACTIINGKPYLPGGRIFEGFRLYRSEDPSTSTPNPKSFTLLKQYDLPDDKFGYNVGIESTFVDTNLMRGKRYWYAVTSFGLPDMTILAIPSDPPGSGTSYDTLLVENTESSLGENAKRIDLSFSVSEKFDQVLVVPNPYRVDHDYTFETGGWEGRANNWTENNRLVKFIHLPKKCTIRILTIVGDLVATLEHDDPVRGELEWNLLSASNRALASGVYIFIVESDLGKQIGKFALIR